MGETVTAIGTTAGSFDDLYRERWLGMLRLGVFLLGDVPLAEDVVQDAFAALYRRWPSMRDSTGAAGYLRVSVVNGARSA